MRQYQTIPIVSRRTRQALSGGLAGYGYVNETLQIAMAAYSMFGPKPKVTVDVPVYTAQPPPPTYTNWTPVIVLGGIAAIGLTMIMTKPRKTK